MKRKMDYMTTAMLAYMQAQLKLNRSITSVFAYDLLTWEDYMDGNVACLITWLIQAALFKFPDKYFL